ncbi:MAG: acyl-CoA dehydrogenase family protein [Acidimicrobiia bacterium]
MSDIETVDAFRTRARAWIEANLPSRDEPLADAKTLQALLFDNGFAGIAFPKEYGGAGLTLEHQRAFFAEAEAARRQIPAAGWLMVSVGMLGPTILDWGSHEAKLRFLPPLLRGDEVWMQLLSEPRGGSDMAGAITRLTKDGDSYILNGAKMWSTHAYASDYGLCLCRSDWDVPKHKGLSMIAVPLQNTPGVVIERTKAADRTDGEFCQEFFDDVVLPASNLIGEPGNGWAVAQALLLHERNAVADIGHGHLGRLMKRAGGGSRGASAKSLKSTAQARGEATVAATATRIADTYIEEVIGRLASARIMTGLRTGAFKGQWGSLIKLAGSVSTVETQRTALMVSGADGVIWDGDEIQLDNPGTGWLGARGGTLAGGSNEMQRNIVSERLIGLPREPSFDRDLPFNEVLRNLGKFGS